MTTSADWSAYLTSRAQQGLLRDRAKQSVLVAPDCDFSTNDYLGFASHPSLHKAMAGVMAEPDAMAGGRASRVVTGSSPLLAVLEAQVADWKGTQAALVMPSGFQANATVIPALGLSRDTWLFSDKLNHVSLNVGCQLALQQGGARHWKRYQHLDLDHLEALLQRAPRHAPKWIITDTVFSMDGDLVPLADLANLAERYGARLYLDEAHAAGVLGAHWGGVVDATNLGHHPAVLQGVQMGTFSKALGGHGAYVVGQAPMIDALYNRTAGLIYTTALPNVVLGMNLAALSLLAQDADRPVTLHGLRRHMVSELMRLDLMGHLPETLAQQIQGHELGTLPAAICPLVVHTSDRALQLQQDLASAGFLVPAIRPPTVPINAARLRLSLSALQTPDSISQVLKTIAERMAED